MTVGMAALMLGLSLWVASGSAAQLTVAQAIQAQDKIFTASPGYKLLAHFKLGSEAQTKAAIPKLEHTHALLEHAAAVVAATPATTSVEKTGQGYWVSGARKVATGIGDLATGLTDLVKGDKAAASKILKKSVLLDKQGGALAAKGDKLLGLPTSA